MSATTLSGSQCMKRADAWTSQALRGFESICATLAMVKMQTADVPTMIDKLAWLHVEERKLLVVRSHGKKLFYLPGGKRDAGESDQEALIREIQEELSIELKQASITPAGVFSAQADAMPEGVEVRLSCYRAEFDGRLQIANEIAEIRWLGSAERRHLSAVGRRVIDQLVGQGLID